MTAADAEWPLVSLSDVTERIMVGIASAATHAYRPSGVPLIRNQNIKPGRLDDRDLLRVDPRYERAYKNKRLREGDLLTVRTGYPGTTCVVPAAFEGAQSFTTLISRPQRAKVDSQFLSHYINSELGQFFFTQSQIGGAQKNVNAGVLRGMPLPLPRTQEQRAIAAVLDSADSLIEILERMVAKKRNIKQGMMQELLAGRTRLPGFAGDWRIRKIGDFAEVRAGGTPSTAIARYWGGDVLWMSSGEIHKKRVWEVAGRITQDGLWESSAQVLPVGTVLMALAGQGKTRGTVAISRVELATNQSIAGILPSREHDSDFLYYNLDTRYGELRGESAGEGGRGGLNLTIIKKLDVLMPPPDEQAAIASVLVDVDAELAALERRLECARSIKTGMTQELLTGRTRLPVEAAS
ncbi:restriction endonuclease subunit S [Streptomyces sp. NPDC003480]